MAELEVWKSTAIVPVSILGQDDEGRTLVRCPECGDTATVMEDGEIRCPFGETIQAALSTALEGLF